MSSISMLGMTISSVASSLFEELYNNQKLWSKLKYMIKKYLLPHMYCVVLDDYSFSKLSLLNSEKQYILLHPEKILSLILSDGDRSNLKKLKIESFDTYLLTVSKKLKKIMNNMRFLHNKSKFIVVCSSYSIAKQLHLKDKNIYSFMPDDELFIDMQSKALDVKELNHVKALREIQKNDINLTRFDSWKQLNNLMCDLSDGSMKYIPMQPSESKLKEDDEHDDDE